ncbi:Zn-ribbon domain-containing OB-fold protein [Natronorubrum sp. FCH18a]|uniref:Zn-ribbon domain-containing OB-fold protein n=1 Tax=Natronorubrum sp. FCH18a TaxID=3447018 RepID=UPI003F515DF0
MAEIEPFAQGFMTGMDDGIDAVRLCGVECHDCGVALFGTRNRCENCASEAVEPVTFSRTGEVASYTVQRHPPTDPFKVGTTDREEWSPRPVGYIDLPEGVRLLSAIEADPAAVEIGDSVELSVSVGWEEDETTYLTYAFEPTGGESDE